MALVMTMSEATYNPRSDFKGRKGFQKSSQMRMLSNTLSFHGLNPSLPFYSQSRRVLGNCRIVCTAASAGGGSSESSNNNPYKVLGVSPLENFEKIKTSYTRKFKDAERRGDEAAMAQLESAYDKIMMAQLSNRKQGLTFGSVKVSKDIRYADKQPIVPWAPRMFEKLKGFKQPLMQSASEDVENESQSIRTGKRLLRSLALVFGCVAVSSLAYTGILNAIEFFNSYIPRVIIDGQELFVTLSSAIMLFFLGSYYR